MAIRSLSGWVLAALLGFMAGCGGGGGSSASVQVPDPVITSFTADKSEITEGEGVHLVAQFQNGSGVIDPGAVAVTNGLSTTVTPAVDTAYVLTVRNSAGKTVTKSVSVAVLPRPKAVITAPATVTIGTVDNVASVPDQTGCTYAWSVLAGNATLTTAPTARSVKFSGNVVGSVALQCVVTNKRGVSDTQAVTIAVVDQPVATITGPANLTINQANCIASVAAQQGCRYVWEVVAGQATITAGAGTAQITFKPTALGTLTLKCYVANTAGTVATGTFTISVWPNPDATISAPQKVGAGKTGLAASVPFQSGNTYAWSIVGEGSVITSGSNTNQILFTAGSTATAILRCTVTNGAGVSTSQSTTVTIVPAPVILAFSADTNLIAKGERVTLTYTFSGGSAVLQPGNLVLATSSTSTMYPATTTDYVLKVTNELGENVSSIVHVDVKDTIISSVALTPKTVRLALGEKARFSAVVACRGISNLAVTWSIVEGANGGTIDASGNYEAPRKNLGPYHVVATSVADGTKFDTAVVITTDDQAYPLPGATNLVVVPMSQSTLQIGSPDSETGRFPNESPMHLVRLQKLAAIGKFEVTIQQYTAVMNPSGLAQVTSPDYPISGVAWTSLTGVGGFLDKLNELTKDIRPAGKVFRLPTESEWEFACRAGSTTRFPWGDDPTYSELNNYSVNANNSNGHTWPVGSKLPNAWGVYDMLGNVYEWCQDSFGPYEACTLYDPSGPTPGSAFSPVIRGGSYKLPTNYLRPAYRNYYGYQMWDNTVGFRVALGDPVPLTPVPAITSFSVAPDAVYYGDLVNVSWSTQDATTITIEPDIGVVGPSGSKWVSLGATTDFILKAEGPGGLRSATVHAQMNSWGTITNVQISPAALSVNPGLGVEFWASVSGTDQYDRNVIWTATGGDLEWTGPGTYTRWYPPDTPGIYRVRATSNQDPTHWAEAVITVVSPNSAPFSLSSSDIRIAPGTTSTLLVVATRVAGHTAPITLQLVDPPSGVQGTGTIAAGSMAGKFSITVGPAVSVGTYHLVLQGSDGQNMVNLGFNLLVNVNPMVTIRFKNGTSIDAFRSSLRFYTHLVQDEYIYKTANIRWASSCAWGPIDITTDVAYIGSPRFIPTSAPTSCGDSNLWVMQMTIPAEGRYKEEGETSYGALRYQGADGTVGYVALAHLLEILF